MFGGIQNLFMKKMLKSQMKNSGLSEADQEKMIAVMMENPELFKKIAEEAQVLMKEKNMNQMNAMTVVAGKYKAELAEISKKLQ